jgi:hypothetical protein
VNPIVFCHQPLDNLPALVSATIVDQDELKLWS